MYQNYYNPYGYVPPVPQTAPVQQAQTPTNQGSFQWVKGEAEAESYLVAPNSSVMLMDSENKCFYIKSADSMGMPQPLRTFDFKERVTKTVSETDFVTREEFEKRFAELKGETDDE